MPSQTFYRLQPARQAQMLSAAVALFSSGKYEDISIRSIIKAMGVTTGSFYRYFESKEKLYIFLVDEMLTQFWRKLGVETTGIDSHVPLDDIDRLVPVQAQFWHTFFASSSEIRKKYYFRVDENKLYARFLRSLKQTPEAAGHSPQILGLTAFLLTTLNYVVMSFREISGHDYRDDDIFPVMRDMLLIGFRAMSGQTGHPQTPENISPSPGVP